MPAKPTHKKKEKGRQSNLLPQHPYSLTPYSLTTFILIVPPPQPQKGRGDTGRAPEGNNIAGMARSRENRHLR